MKLIELHILQSFPVSCLNRDDVNAPKTAIFGGAIRARISSQCLKRAIREMAKKYASTLFAAKRSRLIVEPLKNAIIAQGVEEIQAIDLAKAVTEFLVTFDSEKEKKDGILQAKTLMYLSPEEINAIARKVAEAIKTAAANVSDDTVTQKKKKDVNNLNKLAEKACRDACKTGLLKDAADIAIFGRMVANDHSLTVEGAGMFSHALSTHKSDNDLDFWTAVDDEKQKDEDAGAGNMGTAEFTSACYYRYAALNLDLLSDSNHLATLTPEELKQVVDAFIRATLLAVPGARKNSMNANTLPVYVLGIVKEQGQPIQLVNAFEKPVWSKNGLVEKSIEDLKNHHEALKKTWGIKTALEIAIPDKSLDDFCGEILGHV